MVPLVPMLEKSLFFSSYFSISTRVSRKLFSAIWAKILNFVGHEFDLKSKNDFYKIQNLICHWNSIFQLSNYIRVFLNIYRTYVCTVQEYVFNTLYLIWHFKGTVSRDFLLQFFYDSYPSGNDFPEIFTNAKKLRGVIDTTESSSMVQRNYEKAE